jgi:hypothetical protein
MQLKSTLSKQFQNIMMESIFLLLSHTHRFLTYATIGISEPYTQNRKKGNMSRLYNVTNNKCCD